MRTGFLIQIILPLYRSTGERFARDAFSAVRRELTDRFGGSTAHTRAPAEGTWEDRGGFVHHDDVIVVEVMTDALDRRWWGRYAEGLARRFEQQSLVVRAMPFEALGSGI